ncbi:MAG: hypothetical protein QM730_26340 [Anaerolineales bacterium]
MKFLRFLSNEFFLGTLIAVLSVFTAVASYQGGMADSKQNEFEIKAMKDLNDGNAEYLRANQMIVYDYTMFDGWYTAKSADKEEYYQANYSQPLQDAIAANADEPFSEAYYDAMYADSYTYWDNSDAEFDTAGQYDERGDGLQLVMLTLALGLAFAAWASLAKDESNMRLAFSVLGTAMLILGIIFYVMVPAVA